MKKFDLFKLLANNGYYGTDTDTETSLLEYGLLVKDGGVEFHCIYGVEQSRKTGDYITFDTGWKSKKEIDETINESWFDKQAFLDYMNITESEWLKCDYCSKLNDLIRYYGYENILGTPYDAFNLLGLGRLARNINKKNKKK